MRKGHSRKKHNEADIIKGDAYYKGNDAFNGKFQEHIAALEITNRNTKLINLLTTKIVEKKEPRVRFNIQTPLGIFHNVDMAAAAHQCSIARIRQYLKNNPDEFKRISRTQL